jgi:hypothetical protein
MKYRLGQRVKITGCPHTDGSLDQGKIIGIELHPRGIPLGYISRNEYENRFTEPTYKVAYIMDCTQRAQSEWFTENQLGGIRDK